jgi:histidinol-phosphate/aromatic aminotransferase/cobyric acid decarboxylase-like protein
MAVRPSVRGGIRLTIRTKKDDERLLNALGSLGGV